MKVQLSYMNLFLPKNHIGPSNHIGVQVRLSQLTILGKRPWDNQQKHAQNGKFVKNASRKSVGPFT